MSLGYKVNSYFDINRKISSFHVWGLKRFYFLSCKIYFSSFWSKILMNTIFFCWTFFRFKKTLIKPVKVMTNTLTLIKVADTTILCKCIVVKVSMLRPVIIADIEQKQKAAILCLDIWFFIFFEFKLFINIYKKVRLICNLLINYIIIGRCNLYYYNLGCIFIAFNTRFTCVNFVFFE